MNVFSIREIAENIRTGLTSVQTAIDSLSIIANNTNTNTLTVTGGSHTIINQTITDGQTLSLFPGINIERMIGSFTARRLSDGVLAINSGFNSSSGNLVNSGGLVLSLTAGDLEISATGDDFEFWMSFTSVPLLPGGIVGPVGISGADGHTPYIQAGTWWINGTDTGISATGPAGDGLTKTAWANLTLSGNWVNIGPSYGYPVARYRLFDDVVHLDGIVNQPSSWAGNPLVAILPSGYRPTYVQTFPVQTSNGLARVEIYANGEIKWISATAGTYGWLSINLKIYTT